ncbi:hypothetical protein [Thioclava sp. FTW29]|uniref:Uncharacterized protein n=1 Tax=Thioclava litoralis TaxID=3076557 RepID=A0ABZ1E3X4_9RHOB|nr:hypothetical protein RPE78_15135 [Thioclava sp. FTW29]
MPLMSMQIAHDLWTECGSTLEAALPEIRQMLCRELSVPMEFCHLTLVPVYGLPDQAQASADLRVLEKPERSLEQVRAAALKLQDMLSAAAQVRVAVRVTMMDPARYFALR